MTRHDAMEHEHERTCCAKLRLGAMCWPWLRAKCSVERKGKERDLRRKEANKRNLAVSPK